MACVRSFLDEVALSGVTLLCQDRGGLIGLRLVGQQPERFAAVVAAYEAPFPDESLTAGAGHFPMLVPTAPDDPGAIANRQAWPGLAAFDGPFVTAFSDGDPVTRGGDRELQGRVAGAAGQPHVVLAGGGHFLQEDVGPQLAEVVVATLRRAGGTGASTGNAGPRPAV